MSTGSFDSFGSFDSIYSNDTNKSQIQNEQNEQNKQNKHNKINLKKIKYRLKNVSYDEYIKNLNLADGEWREKYGVPEIIKIIYEILEKKAE